MMRRQEWTERVLMLAKARGCEAAEVYGFERDAFSVSALNFDVDRCSVSKNGGMSLRVQLRGRDGYAYTECPDDPQGMVERAMDNAQSMETEDAHPMQSANAYETVSQPELPVQAFDAAQKIALALELERLTLAEDARVQKVVSCTVQTGAGRLWMQNTKGLLAQREAGSALCYVEPLVVDNGETRTGFAFRMGTEAADVAGCAAEAVADALAQLGGAPVASGTYRVILRNTAMADLLTGFSRMFSAEQAQKGCSLLNGREGEQIGSSLVTLVDDPFDAIAPRAFDDEGTPCTAKSIIRDGVFCTMLHNLKTAKKAGVLSTGNAVRASAASPVDVGPHILRLQSGQSDFDALVQELGDGLIITDLQGLHAGLNAVSGDFSLKATGRRIVHGADTGAVSGITLAGNFLTLLARVCSVADDARFTLPGSCYTVAPSVLVEALQVGGK